ncbi:MFS transporter [Brevibacterium epidermidis]|uniref:MFS transporter n=1 Tax=Brevibacterium epidermidis TaxID=1698 RepID=UPI000B16F327|nr:MFS transporter [Brevibacterium epidermidis]
MRSDPDVLTWLPSYFEVGLGYSRLNSGVLLAAPSLAGLISMVSGTLLSDRLSAKGWPTRAVRIVFPALCAFIGAVVLPLANAAVSQICPPAQTAGTLGVFLALMAIGGLVGPYVTGLIVDAASDPGLGYATAFRIMGIVSGVRAVLAIVLADPDRDKQLVRGKASA